MIETWIRVGISARGILNEITIELKKVGTYPARLRRPNVLIGSLWGLSPAASWLFGSPLAPFRLVPTEKYDKETSFRER